MLLGVIMALLLAGGVALAEVQDPGVPTEADQYCLPCHDRDLNVPPSPRE
jgi:hypothetical protein